jgi:cytochrome c oxidase cbb3-type subunit 2
MGIGMAQHLHRIPVWFVSVAAALFALPLAARYGRDYWREAVAMVLVLTASWGVNHLLAGHAKAQSPTPAERGRQVYISEGCINCHSQYVRPHSWDVEMWGPAGNLEAIRHEQPPLIGNRRQGPDLSNVGARRSPLWLRIHLIDPRAVSYGSIMPSYAYLFRDRRGDDLVAYLSSLHNPGARKHILHMAATWEPPPSAASDAEHLKGKKLYTEFCATCHSADGYARQRWGKDFTHLPPALDKAKIDKLASGKTPAELQLRLERIIKYGQPGTDMPGHEYLPPAQIEAVARYLAAKQ